MAASVEEPVFESSVLGQIVPPVVFQLPSVMTKAVHDLRRKRLRVEGGDPEPLVLGRLRLNLSSAVVILNNAFFKPDHPNGPRILDRERQCRRVPDLELVAWCPAILNPRHRRGAGRRAGWRIDRIPDWRRSR